MRLSTSYLVGVCVSSREWGAPHAQVDLHAMLGMPLLTRVNVLYEEQETPQNVFFHILYVEIELRVLYLVSNLVSGNGWHSQILYKS